MTELPSHLQPDQPDAWRTPLQAEPVSSRRMKADRPFYKKKRYIVPALLLTLAYCGGQDDTSTDRVTADSPAPAASSSPSPTFDRQAFLAEQQRVADENATALAKADADRKAAEKAAAEKAAAEAAAKEAARVEAERVAAAEAARVEAERVAARQAAAEVARVEAERQAAEQAAQQPQAPSTSTFYANCDAVRAAGAAPIRVGDPGYSRNLDRDGDGQGCGAD